MWYSFLLCISLLPPIISSLRIVHKIPTAVLRSSRINLPADCIAIGAGVSLRTISAGYAGW